LAHLSKRLLVLAGALASMAAEPAEAGTFHVYGLGMNGAGCPNGWQAQSSPAARFRHSSSCSRWEVRSVRDGKALKHGNSAGISMVAGSGARFTGFSVRSQGTARNGAYWNVAMCRTPYANCQTHFPRTGTWDETEVQLGTLMPGGSAYYAQHVWAGARCGQTTCADSTSAGRAVNVAHFQTHAVVEDYTTPGKPSIGIAVHQRVPADGSPAVAGGKGAVLCSVGNQLVKHHGYGLGSLRAKHHFRAANLCIGACRIRRQFPFHQFCQRYTQPPTVAQKLVC